MNKQLEKGLATFIEATQTHGREMDLLGPDRRKANRAAIRSIRALGVIRRFGAEGDAALHGLLTHEDPWVRLSAAVNLLQVCPDEAAPVIEDIEAHYQKGVGGIARTVLELWRKGELQHPFWDEDGRVEWRAIPAPPQG
jgi:hypothetical protein